MAETDDKPAALKEIFDRARLRKFADDMASIKGGFDRERFMAIAARNLDGLGIMQRMRQVAEAFDATLPADFETAVGLVRELAPRVQHGFASIALCEFVLIRGRGHFDAALAALAALTRYGSAEFAIRPFLQDDLARGLQTMRRWADDENEHVRRLASEGARPRLPWSFHIRALVADPSPALPILDALKADPSLYVRKSVANHLNDIGKDHPALLVETVSGWDRSDARTAWIAKHALRTLIKSGDAGALAVIGAGEAAKAEVTRFVVAPAEMKLGERLAISASITSTATGPQRVVADYAIHYVKKSGRPSRKVFKLKVLELAPGQTADLSISQILKDFTTRTHHPGQHKVELMLNGAVVAEGGFDLMA